MTAACRLSAFRRMLARDTRGAVIIEFALALPILLMLLLGGLEIANLTVAHMRINQIAISLADNASRLKQQTIGGAPQVREYDVNEAFKAAELQGADLNLMQNGRLFLSSLETNGEGGQWIHWQRCKGVLTAYQSSYGVEGDGAIGTSFPGMGPADERVTVEPGGAIMVAEVVYRYQPLIGGRWAFGDFTIRKYAAMYVRDDRDLSGAGIFNPAPQASVSRCV